MPKGDVMTDKKPVVVYGASGYTGRLVCEYLREYNVPFIAAGRDKERIQEVLDRIPGIDDRRPRGRRGRARCRGADRTVPRRKGRQQHGRPVHQVRPEVVEAGLAAGCHYLDTTGEQDWVLDAQAKWGDRFAEKGLLLSPGIAQMYTTGEIAANICLETPGLDTLDILVLWKGFPTYASTQTIFTILKADWYYLEQNQYVQWDPGTTFEVSCPDSTRRRSRCRGAAPAIPCGSRTIRGWPTCKVAGGVFDRTVMEGVVATAEDGRGADQDPCRADQQEAALAEVAASVQASMPPRENPRVNTSLDSVYASGPLGRAHCVIHGNCNYKQTGLLQAYAAYSLLQQPPRRTGSRVGLPGVRSSRTARRAAQLRARAGAGTHRAATDRPAATSRRTARMRLDRLSGQGRLARPGAPCLTMGDADADLRRRPGPDPTRSRRALAPVGDRAGRQGGHPVRQRPDRVRLRVRDRPGRRRVVPDQPAERGGREPGPARPLRLPLPDLPERVRAAGRADPARPAAARRRSSASTATQESRHSFDDGWALTSPRRSTPSRSTTSR